MKELVGDAATAEADAGYGCAVANRFGQLLDDEGDPFDLLYRARALAEGRKKKEEAKRAQTATSKSNRKESQRDRKALPRATEDPTKPAPGVHAGQKRLGRAQPEEKPDRRVAFSENRSSEAGDSLGYSIERPVDLSDRGARGRGGGRGRGARGFGYSRSNDGFDPRGKREFERHSGSDRASVRPEEKRGGSGPRNWGSMKDHVSAVADAAPIEEGGEEVTETTDLENGPVETEEVLEVALEMSLDEWKAMKEQSRPKVDFNIRKADTRLPPKAVVIHKSKRTESQGQNLDEDDAGCRRPANDITCQVDINFGSLGRPTRGGRGGRGGRGRGATAAPTAERSPQKYTPEIQAPNPDDPEQFPALA